MERRAYLSYVLFADVRGHNMIRGKGLQLVHIDFWKLSVGGAPLTIRKQRPFKW